MDIISINVATNKTIAKLKDDGIERLTLIGDDGKQYEVTVDEKGALAVTVKKTDGGGGDGVEITFGERSQYTSAGFSEFGTVYKISDIVPTEEQIANMTLVYNMSDGTSHTLSNPSGVDNNSGFTEVFSPIFSEKDGAHYFSDREIVVNIGTETFAGVGVYVMFARLDAGGAQCIGGTLTFPEM